MRPVLKPALRRLWRDDATVQLGVDPRRAVVLCGVGGTEARLLAALDGTRDREGVVAAAQTLGIRVGEAHRLLDLLDAAGALDDGAAAQPEHTALPAPERERLGPDLAALSLLRTAPHAVMAQRRRSAVRVVGAGRVGAQVATLLAAAGVGRLCIDDHRATRPADAAPGGLSPSDAGLPRVRAVANAVRRAAPAVALEPLRPGDTTDLTVLTAGPLTPAEQDLLVRTHQPHLAAAVVETTGVVGPLVVPGSACLRCLDLTRTERDPAWPRIAAQLANHQERVGEPCDVVLAAIVAAYAAQQALHQLDRAVTGDPPPASVGGTLELAAPDWRLRRRSWQPHPACGCHWSP